MGAAVRLGACLAAACVLLQAPWAMAGQRFALVVSGAAGGHEYVAQYDRWTADLSKSLVENLKFDSALVTVLSDTAEALLCNPEVRRAYLGE